MVVVVKVAAAAAAAGEFGGLLLGQHCRPTRIYLDTEQGERGRDGVGRLGDLNDLDSAAPCRL